MSTINMVRDIVDESVALADAFSLRFRKQALVRDRAWESSSSKRTIKTIQWPTFPRFARLKARHIAASAIALSAAAAPLAWSWTLYPELAALRERMNGIVVQDAVGNDGGVMVRQDGLSTRDGSGRVVPIISMPVRAVPKDFLAAAAVLEGEGILGINPANIVRAVVCLPFERAGFESFSAVRLKNGRCGGGSTLTAQAVRSVTDRREYGAARKLREALYAIGLSLHLVAGSEEHSRFISDTLHFGYASGLPLYGVRNTARAVFGKDERELELDESLRLAAMLLYPVALSCGPQRERELERFEKIRRRAIYALERGFRDDPRYEATKSKLLSMEPLTAAASAPNAIAPDHDSNSACLAASHPLLQLEVQASGAKLAAAEELSKLGTQHGSVRAIRLSITFAEQTRFIAETRAALNAITKDQRNHWQVGPTGKNLSILSFATNRDGTLAALYESSAHLQMNHERELGSLVKIPALIFLAEEGLKANERLCNKASPPFTNAGGDPGVDDCTRSLSGLMTIDQVWSKSTSLAVLDALRRHPPEVLASRMNELGIKLPKGVEPAFAVAFGLARTTPARMQAILASISAGLAGEGSDAISKEPQIIASFRTADGQWRKPMPVNVDLSSTFAVPGAREVIARGSIAAFLPGGTLSALGPAPIGSVGKTGTLDTETRGRVRLKASSGAWAGGGWFTLAVPQRDALGDSSISILPIARIARDAMIRGIAAHRQYKSQTDTRHDVGIKL